MDSFSDIFSAGARADGPLPSAAGKKLAAFVLREFFEGLVSLRTGDLISKLQDLRAIEQFIAKKERCDVGALIKQSLKHHQTAAARKQIVFLSGISSGLWAHADSAVLRQIFDEVISNAIKYSPINSTIQVHALLDDDMIAINIRDQGLGINEASRQKLFQKFARLVSCPAGVACSTDVRLAIVKKLAEALAGSIRWRSALGSGSTFTLTLPAANREVESSGASGIKMFTRNLTDAAACAPALPSRN